MGTSFGTAVALIAELRGRRRAVSPWADRPPIDLRRYALVGALVGVGIGGVLGIVDLLLS